MKRGPRLRYHFEDFVLDGDKLELRRGADVASVAPQVCDLLGYLIRSREHVVSKDDLIWSVSTRSAHAVRPSHRIST